jgi:hypothetical protein
VRLVDEGVSTVSRYTLRFFGDGGEPQGTEEVDCESDGEAINAVNDRADPRATELWQANRRILCWPASQHRHARHPRPRLRFPH